MIIKKAYKFRLKPSKQQLQQFIEIAGGCRFVWNKVLHLNLKRLEDKQNIIWYREADYWTKLWKKSAEYGFLKAVPAHCLQQKLRDLDKAFRDAFDKTQPLKRLPRMKKRVFDDSFRFPEPTHFEISNRRIKLPKIGWVGFVKSREIIGVIKNATISRHAGHWYVSIQVEEVVAKPILNATTGIGIDLGVATFATLSDGTMIDGPTLKLWEGRLIKNQRQLAKKRKFSNNWKKQVSKIQKLHVKIADIRRDFLHKISTQLSKSHAMIVVEDLKITNMSKSATGTLEQPGKNVNAKAGLNKSILAQGWGEFKRQLSYKLAWLGKIFLAVAPHHTSQRCHCCGYCAKENRPTQQRFCCRSCGFEQNADVNAAKNILAAGHAVLACGEIGLPNSMRQEPLGIGDLVPA